MIQWLGWCLVRHLVWHGWCIVKCSIYVAILKYVDTTCRGMFCA